MTGKTVLHAKDVWDPNKAGFEHPQPFSQGISTPAGRTVWTAGQVALDETGAVVGAGDPAKQTEATLENLRRVLAAGGATLSDVVRLTVYLTDMAHLPAIQKVRAQYFPSDPPVSSTIGITCLVNPELVIEIDAVAVVHDG
jgi:enamine deaminase RidA (YjgF/YER057c/UK114 family)